MTAWQAPRACSVIGAAHLRRGQPCQDASLSVSLRSRSGTLQLMVVADGHGSARYALSHRGSALACEVAQQAVEAALIQTALTDRQGWQRLLQQELVTSIQQRWLDAIQADWQQRPEASDQAFSPLSYGTTLGLVLLAPQWWGCTGLGDWDLVGVTHQGSAELLSEERDHSSSEATGSLCQPPEHQQWQQRARLEEGSALRALVLSTDGVRKSCATDADYLRLCAGVVELQDSDELQAGLAQITAEGSGDDVSLAIALRGTPAQHRRSRWGSVLLAAAALTLGGWLWSRRETPLQAIARELCAQPEQIRATLSQRRAQFRLLLAQPQATSQLRQRVAVDPLGALIATSQAEAVPGCPQLTRELAWQWQRARAPQPAANGKMPSAAMPGTAPVNP